MVNFWDTGMEIISLIKEIWEEPTPLKLETLRVKINEEIKKTREKNRESRRFFRILRGLGAQK